MTCMAQAQFSNISTHHSMQHVHVITNPAILTNLAHVLSGRIASYKYSRLALCLKNPNVLAQLYIDRYHSLLFSHFYTYLLS